MAPARVVLPLLVVAISVSGYLYAQRAVDDDRHSAAMRQAASDAQQVQALLTRASTVATGFGSELASEPKPDGSRFQTLVGSGAVSVGLPGGMWVQPVTRLERRGYEAKLGAPITEPPGTGVSKAAASYLPATFVTGLPFRRGANMAVFPVLASTLRSPASVFAGTATPGQRVAGERGFFLVQGARFGHGPQSEGFLVVFVPAGWLGQQLTDTPDRTNITLDGRRLTGSVRKPAAGESFLAHTQRWRIDVAPEPVTSVQSILPKLALAWPLVTALILFVVGRGIVRRRRAEREVDDVFDLSLDLLCIVGVDGYLERVNPAFERTLGYDPDELLKRPLIDFVDPADRQATGNALARLGEGESQSFESRFVRADGTVRWLQWNARALLQRGLVYAAAHDVTENRLLTEEQAALRRVATLVAEEADPDDVFEAVATEVAELLAADETYLLRYEPDGATVGVARHSTSEIEHPVAPESTVEAPILVSGRRWGTIVAAWKDPAMIRADTEARLGQFTELVATAVANEENRALLAESRRRVVAAADESRKRIERDLHDGAQQRLVGSIFKIKLAEEAIGDGSEDASKLIREACDSTEGALEELRELAQGIHPAVLATNGLEPALKVVARRSPIPVELEIRIEERLPERIEVTAYYVVSEALTNAAKHSAASVVQVLAERVDGRLRLSVRDDGVGGADASRGSGLIGLRDRVEAVGGSLSVTSLSQGGTQLEVELPFGPT